jgi:nucleoside-diphosphate-sugar epimerase
MGPVQSPLKRHQAATSSLGPVRTEARQLRVLVTGQRGYIGSILVPLLQGAGHEVLGLDSDLYRGCDFGNAAMVPAVPQVADELRDVTAAQLDRIEAIVHLAALSNDPLGDLDPALTYEINHLASVRLARLGR